MSGEKLDLILLFSLGRSGSTFLAKAIGENSDYVNAGENRYFWQELVKKPRERHPEELARFFLMKGKGACKVLDKTPDLYRHIEKVNFGDHRVQCVELVRSPDAIAASRVNFVTTLRKPKRWSIRIRDYRRDYGWRWFIPVLQRWYMVPAMLGIGRSRAFATGAGQQELGKEGSIFNTQMERVREKFGLVTVDYDDFHRTVESLGGLGLDDSEIEEIKSRYR